MPGARRSPGEDPGVSHRARGSRARAGAAPVGSPEHRPGSQQRGRCTAPGRLSAGRSLPGGASNRGAAELSVTDTARLHGALGLRDPRRLSADTEWKGGPRRAACSGRGSSGPGRCDSTAPVHRDSNAFWWRSWKPSCGCGRSGSTTISSTSAGIRSWRCASSRGSRSSRDRGFPWRHCWRAHGGDPGALPHRGRGSVSWKSLVTDSARGPTGPPHLLRARSRRQRGRLPHTGAQSRAPISRSSAFRPRGSTAARRLWCASKRWPLITSAKSRAAGVDGVHYHLAGAVRRRPDRFRDGAPTASGGRGGRGPIALFDSDTPSDGSPSPAGTGVSVEAQRFRARASYHVRGLVLATGPHPASRGRSALELSTRRVRSRIWQTIALGMSTSGSCGKAARVLPKRRGGGAISRAVATAFGPAPAPGDGSSDASMPGVDDLATGR